MSRRCFRDRRRRVGTSTVTCEASKIGSSRSPNKFAHERPLVATGRSKAAIRLPTSYGHNATQLINNGMTTSPAGWHCLSPELVVVAEDIDVLSVDHLEGGPAGLRQQTEVDHHCLVAIAELLP